MNIIGAGGFAREISSYAKHSVLGEDSKLYFFETTDIYKERENVHPLKNCRSDKEYLIAIGNGQARKNIVEEYNLLRFSYFIAEKSVFESETSEGLIVCPGVVVTDNVRFGKHVVVNINSTIGHDCRIGDYVTINPGVNISGNVKIGNGVTIGTNACIRDGISICDNVVIGMGAVVVKSITKEGVYLGNPAKRQKSEKEKEKTEKFLVYSYCGIMFLLFLAFLIYTIITEGA